jgi:anti-sigma-K factor RskA
MAAAGIAACLLVASIAIAVMRLGSSDAIPSDDPAALLAELRHRPGVQMLVMVGSPNAPSAVGQIMLDPGDTRAAMLVSGLPPLRVDQAYQLWFVQPDETRISGAVFSVDSNGAAIVAVNAPPDFSRDWRCGVTEEPAGGSAAPTGRNVLIARYAADPETRQTYDEMP